MSRCFSALIFAVVLANSSTPWAQSAADQQSWQKLANKAKVYLVLSDDITQMLNGKQGTNEFEFGFALTQSAQQAVDYMNAASDLIWIYNQISDARDRETVRSLINKRLDVYSQLLEGTIRMVNASLSRTASAGIVATGLRLRDELRDGQSLLNLAKVR